MAEANIVLNNPQPFTEAELREKKKNLPILLFITLILMGIMITLDRHLVSFSSTPEKYGIVSLELARTPQKANTIIDSWGNNGKGIALFSLGLDYLFIAAYTATLWLFCRFFAQSLREKNECLSKTGNFLSWMVILAGILDVIENQLLLIMLLSKPYDMTAATATLAASGKFVLLFITGTYLFVCIIAVILYAFCGPSPEKRAT